MPQLPQDLQQALAGRYLLERELGAGGMATVYLAQDLRHGRPVAMKVLRSELSASLGPEEAVALLDEVLRAQYMVSAAWLALDPQWAPLRGYAPFDRLVSQR